MADAQPKLKLRVRRAKPDDVAAITRIDAKHTGVRKAAHTKRRLADCRKKGGVALVAESAGKVVGYVLGEVRAWEFGSPPTGWLYAVGVDPSFTGVQVGRQLVDEARARFAKDGATTVRTMVQRDNVALLRFFRGAGFIAGPFVELEAISVTGG